jgi:hypothetical protein
VSIAHAYPGTELHDQLARKQIPIVEAMTDDHGHQLPHIDYPQLGRREMMSAVNRFYDEYYFRPRVAWRIVREALWSARERKRLTREALEFLRVRANRKKYARSYVDAGTPA